MKLKFLIDKNYLIHRTLKSTDKLNFSSNEFKKDIIKFQNFAWEISQINYNFLIGRITPDQLSDENIKKMISDLPFFFKKLRNNSNFKNILQQTRNYLEECEKEWDENYSKTSKYISEAIGLELDKKFTIYITHPSLRNGAYVGDNKITWGCSGKWANYNTVYLWHEILHSYLGKSDINHAIIELITDDGLRCLLNNEKYPPFVGHSRLKKIKKQILPEWKKYLNFKDKDIQEFIKRLNF